MPERLIDANKLLKMRFSKGFNDDGELLVPFREVKKAIDLAPTVDAVKVVRCKDCQFRVEMTNGKEFNGITPKYCFLLQKLTCENDYCSRGKRKGDDYDIENQN